MLSVERFDAIYSSDLQRARQTAQASADAYPQLRFPARLQYINPGIDAQRGSVEVKLDVPQPPAYLMQDMTVSVDPLSCCATAAPPARTAGAAASVRHARPTSCRDAA